MLMWFSFERGGGEKPPDPLDPYPHPLAGHANTRFISFGINHCLHQGYYNTTRLLWEPPLMWLDVFWVWEEPFGASMRIYDINKSCHLCWSLNGENPTIFDNSTKKASIMQHNVMFKWSTFFCEKSDSAKFDTLFKNRENRVISPGDYAQHVVCVIVAAFDTEHVK